MQRSSETIGAIAAALAKAQAELANPEKALVATVRSSNPAIRIRPFVMRRCLADSTSCARCLADTKSQPSRQPRSTGRLASFASPRRLPIPRANGSHRNGRCARSRKPRRPAGWARP